jgi:CheY-like chemotaxis protein
MSWPILIVEDDHDARETLAEILLARGYRVSVARDGQEALEQLRTFRPVVVLLDLRMPVMDGHEFLARLADEPSLSSLTVVLLSTQPPAQDAILDQVAAFLPKPLSLPTLLSTIASITAGVPAPGRRYSERSSPIARAIDAVQAAPAPAPDRVVPEELRITETVSAPETVRRILVVEDDQDAREALADMLEAHGYTVSTAANGLEALDLLHRDACPSVIVLDLLMPVMSGGELLQRLTEDFDLGAVPVIAVSGSEPAAPKDARQVRAFLRKPVQSDEILSLIASVEPRRPSS